MHPAAAEADVVDGPRTWVVRVGRIVRSGRGPRNRPIPLDYPRRARSGITRNTSSFVGGNHAGDGCRGTRRRRSCRCSGTGPPRDIDLLVTDVPMPAGPGRPPDPAQRRDLPRRCGYSPPDVRRTAASCARRYSSRSISMSARRRAASGDPGRASPSCRSASRQSASTVWTSRGGSPISLIVVPGSIDPALAPASGGLGQVDLGVARSEDRGGEPFDLLGQLDQAR